MKSKTFYTHLYKPIAVSILCVFSFACIDFLTALLIQSFLHIIEPSSSQTNALFNQYFPPLSLKVLCASLIGIALLRLVIEYFSHVFAEQTQHKTLFVLRQKLFSRFVYTPTLTPSTVNHLNGTVFTNACYFTLLLNRFISFALLTLFLFFFMAYISWKQALICVALTSSVGLIAYFLSKKIQQIAAEVPKQNNAITQLIQKISQNLFFIHLSGMEDVETQNMVRSNQSIFDLSMKSARLSSWGASITPFLGMVIIAIIFATSTTTFNGQLFDIVPFLYLFMRYVQALTSTNNYFSQMQPLKPHFQQALTFFLQPTPLSKTSRTTNKKQHKGNIKINFDSVTFGYDKKPLFENLNFEIKENTFVGITGESGQGKSTIFSLILGFVQPHMGTVRINDLHCADFYEKYDLSIGYVGADPFLFYGTLKDNLTYGLNPNISQDEICKMLCSLSLENFATGTKLAMPIDEMLGNLSSGQKQRLCLARALLKKPALLLLDEFSSNLDLATESKIMHEILATSMNTTIVLITHRPSILHKADRTYELANQEIQQTS